MFGLGGEMRSTEWSMINNLVELYVYFIVTPF